MSSFHSDNGGEFLTVDGGLDLTDLQTAATGQTQQPDVRIYQKEPQTPYQRLLASPEIPEAQTPSRARATGGNSDDG